eukprot:gene5819-7018_t
MASEDKRTLYIVGFPLDVKEREKGCTLYVSNIEKTAEESELGSLFMDMSGFLNSNVISKGGRFFVFAQFTDSASATAAMKVLDGKKLASAPENGIRVQLSRTEFRGGK